VTQVGRLLAIVAAIVPNVALAQPTSPQPVAKLTLYKTADSAACSGDVAVWVDPDALAYHLKGDPLFGKTRRGGYNCRKQADAAGYHAAKPR
jgi:hypothetical protein